MCILMQCPSLVPSLKALKESFSMKEIPHLALIARRICVECIKLFHVRFPCIREYVLLLLDLQLVGKLGDDVIYQLVVRQGAQRIDVHVAEYLIVDVAVQLLQKFRGTQLGVHLQEHKSNLTLRGEEGLTATLTYRMVAHQTKVHCHLMKREKPFHTSKFAVFKRNSK